jgi:hypothetical protein
VGQLQNDVRDAGEVGYAARAVLDGNSLDSILEANLQFLQLIVARRASDGGGAFGLPPALALRIRGLGAAALHAAAECPYTLFNLRFEDAAFWRTIARTPGSGAATLRLVADDVAVARTAVFLAWHLAQSNDLAASLVLGMGEDAQRAWRGVALSGLDLAATTALPHLTARWGGHPTFWPRLLDSTGPNDRARADAVRLLGLQLLAADGSWPGAPRSPGTRNS